MFLMLNLLLISPQILGIDLMPKSLEIGMCHQDPQNTIRTFKDLSEYQGNNKPFQVGKPGFKGNVIAFNVKTIDELEKNSFIAQGSNFVEGVILKGKQIKTIEEEAFVTLFCCRSVDLSDNKLTNLSTKVFNGLDNIEELNLSGNLLETVSISTFFLMSPTLEQLYLSRNRFKTINMEAFQSLYRLSVITLDQNKLSQINMDILNATFVQNVNLSFNHLQTLTLNNQLNNLTVLDLSNNHLHEMPYLKLSVLQTLNVSRNSFGIINITKLREVEPELRLLELNNLPMDCHHLQEVVEELHENGIQWGSIENCDMNSSLTFYLFMTLLVITLLTTAYLCLRNSQCIMFRRRLSHLYSRRPREGDIRLVEQE